MTTDRSSRLDGGVRIALVSVTAASLLGGGAAAALAAAGPGTAPTPTAPSAASPRTASAYDFDGSVASLSGESLTVTGPTGESRTYRLTSDTVYHRGPDTSVDRGALHPGLRVYVRGIAGSTADTVTAADVEIRPAHLDGVVTKVSDGTITITDREGFTRQIRVSESTVVRGRDGSTTSATALRSGTPVRAEGSVADDGTTLNADVVAVADASRPAPGVGPARGPAGRPPVPPAGGPARGRSSDGGPAGRAAPNPPTGNGANDRQAGPPAPRGGASPAPTPTEDSGVRGS